MAPTIKNLAQNSKPLRQGQATRSSAKISALAKLANVPLAIS
jgi:hypothetical protein